MDEFKQLLKDTKGIKARYDELTKKMEAPEIIADNNLFRRLTKERAKIEDVVFLREKLEKLILEYAKLQKLEQLESDLNDLVESEKEKLSTNIQKIANELKGLLINEQKFDIEKATINIITNNSKSSDFQVDLYKMYIGYAKLRGFSYDLDDKANILIITGVGAYSSLKFENGIHTSINQTQNAIECMVIVYQQKGQGNLNFFENDIKIDVFHSRGAGGQNVNKVETAARITHIPTGITVTCQDERSQLVNKKKALNKLKEEVEKYYSEQIEKENVIIKNKAEKAAVKREIRTYDYKNGLVTDGRSGITVSLKDTISGKINAFIEAIIIKGLE